MHLFTALTVLCPINIHTCKSFVQIVIIRFGTTKMATRRGTRSTHLKFSFTAPMWTIHEELNLLDLLCLSVQKKPKRKIFYDNWAITGLKTIEDSDTRVTVVLFESHLNFWCSNSICIAARSQLQVRQISNCSFKPTRFSNRSMLFK